MAEMAGGPDVRFDVDSQAGGIINNIGGDQTFNIGAGRMASIGRWVAALGLTVFFGGMAVAVVASVQTEHRIAANLHGSTLPGPYHQYIATTWYPATILVCAGLVVSRLGRVFAGR